MLNPPGWNLEKEELNRAEGETHYLSKGNFNIVISQLFLSSSQKFRLLRFF